MTEIAKGTWLEWNGELRRAFGPIVTPQDDDNLRCSIVGLCWPADFEEWVAGRSAGAEVDFEALHEVRVLSDEEGEQGWAEVVAAWVRETGAPPRGARHPRRGT